MSTTVLSPYRTLSTGHPDMPRPGMRLVFGSAGPNPGALDLGGGEYSLGTDSDWNPDLHSLTVSCVLENVAELHPLFGTGGVAASDASLLLALEWSSPDSGWRGLGSPARVTREQLPAADGALTLLLTLPAGSIRGTGILAVQVFLADPGNADTGDAGIARQKGARLGALSDRVRVVVDGDGSLFPVLEEPLGSEGALWEMRTSWNDPREEPFTSEFVALVLNRDHELFEQLRGGRDIPGRQTPLMRHVLASWIALLVHSVSRELEADFDELVARPALSVEFASIAEAAAVFVRTGDLDTGSPGALFASVQRWLDRRVRATVKELAE
jgi:hypothetical protein